MAQSFTTGNIQDVRQSIDVLNTPINFKYSASVGPFIANTPRKVFEYTVPAGYFLKPILFQSLSSSAGNISQFTVVEKLANYNLGTNTFTADQVRDPSRFFSAYYAEVTTVLSNVATP